MSLVLGVDAGATKTFALVADERGRILGFGQGGPGNHQVAGLKPALAEIRRSCEEALTRAGVSPPVDFGFFGLAGADLPVDFALLIPAIEGMSLARRVRIKNDTMVALRAGLKRSWGVAVICGTGFNAGGIGPDGREVQLPGLGILSGDWGGGGDIAQEVIRLVCRAWDGRGQPTALTEMVLAALEFPSVEELISQLYQSQLDYYPGQFDQRRLLALVPLVFEAAYAGDQVAQDLLVRVGTEVGVTANAIIQRLGVEGTDVEVVLGGSVFKGKGPLLVDTVTQVVHRVAPRAAIVLSEFEPVVGAVFLALEDLGVKVNESVYAHVRASLPHELRGCPKIQFGVTE
ncbi:MAG: ATPase [Anaerolineae bacterium]|jgi:N-acetylglucosamine kinase-like BadF-type ATPase|nr:ATPase [Anaerolineae bacterium]MDH7474078.1 BadF/BadG/BcrA/BcrD ATPase family protein [Anaerolineae bacterium]